MVTRWLVFLVWSLAWACLLSLVPIVFAPAALAQGGKLYYADLKNGMTLGPGRIRERPTLSENKAEIAGQVGTGSPIYQLDDELRYTYFNKSVKNVTTRDYQGAPPTVIELPNKFEVTMADPLVDIIGLASVTPFNKYGRREYHVFVPGKTATTKLVLQAITEVSAGYAKIEVLRGTDSGAWEQRLSPWTINNLNEILHHHLDLTKPSEWTRLITLYLEAERYDEARHELEAALKKFPDEFARQRDLLEKINVLHANRLFAEAKLRQSAGQHQKAAEFLLKFPFKTLPLETQISVQDQVEKMKADLQLVKQLIDALQSDYKLLSPEQQADTKAIVDEITQQMNLDSAVRLADYLRLRSDESFKPEQRFALAVSGWLMGSGGAIDDFSSVRSLLKVRDLVVTYLNGDNEAVRSQTLAQIKAEEGGLAEYVAKILANLRPPKQPPAVRDDDPPGLHRMKVSVGSDTVEYLVQTPPEYDPNRVYPCILALPAMQSSPQFQINYWCGPLIPILDPAQPDKEPTIKDNQRFGHATRYGYIVISPVWADNKQTAYNYTEIEHLRILRCLRDAYRHFSVDTDRVFISGHYAGANAAWDLALAHPDIWAGAVVVSPSPDKHIVQYSGKNARYIPLYVVWGGMDGGGFKAKIGSTIGKYLLSPDFDAIGVEYQGREAGVFPEELPRVFDWMQLSSHRRQRNQTQFECYASRPGDRFFFWLEGPSYVTPNNPVTFDLSDREVFEAAVNPTLNRIVVTSTPSKTGILWLSPELVDFKRKLTVKYKSIDKTFSDLESDVAVLLEDARTRGDRLHPFHMRLDFP